MLASHAVKRNELVATAVYRGDQSPSDIFSALQGGLILARPIGPGASALSLRTAWGHRASPLS
jgi:hypothetical protein